MSYLLSTLRAATPERHHKAVHGLRDGALGVTITYRSDSEIRALVRNGHGLEYGVNLSARGTFCSCRDALYRGVVCNHQLALCVSVLQQTEPTADPIHLWLADSKAALCGNVSSSRIWYRPGDFATNWQDLLCPACFRTWKRPAPLSREEHFYQGQDDQEAAA